MKDLTLLGPWVRRFLLEHSGYAVTLSLIPSFGAFTKSCFVPR